MKIVHSMLLVFITGSFLFGCVGSPVHSTIAYNSVQSSIKSNNEQLLYMKIGMTPEETKKLMGPPERSEGYAWGSAWLYRTAMTSGIYGTSDSDFTPIIFDSYGKVAGWGRNYFTEHIKRYEVSIKNE